MTPQETRLNKYFRLTNNNAIIIKKMKLLNLTHCIRTHHTGGIFRIIYTNHFPEQMKCVGYRDGNCYPVTQYVVRFAFFVSKILLHVLTILKLLNDVFDFFFATVMLH